MIEAITLSHLAQTYGGTLLYPDCAFSSVSTDTRTLVDGQLFVALRGDNFDAHDFVESAALKAVGLVVERPYKQLNRPQWVVADTTQALAQIALMARQQFSGPLIAVTGSSGKTSVKEMIAAILARLGPTLATSGNLNNHIGVPLTLLSLDKSHRYAVIEMGASGPGEIAYLCAIARPQISLVNNVMPAHIEGFGSLEAIADTKSDIYHSLPASGVAILNSDERWSRKWRNKVSCDRVWDFSLLDRNASFRADAIEDLQGTASRFVLCTPQGEAAVHLPLPGRHNVANAVAAAACAMAAGAGLDAVASGLAGLKPVRGRMEARAGRGGSRVLDDTYNANPGSVKAAIDVLATRPGRRVAVLGDMGELGVGAGQLHREVGAHAHLRGIDELWAVGRYAGSIAQGFGQQTRVVQSKAALAAELVPTLDGDTTVLVKGSRSS
ncbi:MAG: UDP-N-acetylmuramoyl-tripeptide--D-alanyl-D-alanine ligase, partial [Bacteroidales bacterium]|nr:UDP-N-acetylmuramoyl-tripeptide--D-alanyl-D-alanine ligase [Bacteroidales bacterium]